jgi:hypothetical protein
VAVEHTVNNVTSYSFLTEMGAQHRPPYATALEECLRVLPMLIEFLADPVTVVGHVRDAATGVPLPAREFPHSPASHRCRGEPSVKGRRVQSP